MSGQNPSQRVPGDTLDASNMVKEVKSPDQPAKEESTDKPPAYSSPSPPPNEKDKTVEKPPGEETKGQLLSNIEKVSKDVDNENDTPSEGRETSGGGDSTNTFANVGNKTTDGESEGEKQSHTEGPPKDKKECTSGTLNNEGNKPTDGESEGEKQSHTEGPPKNKKECTSGTSKNDRETSGGGDSTNTFTSVDDKLNEPLSDGRNKPTDGESEGEKQSHTEGPPKDKIECTSGTSNNEIISLGTSLTLQSAIDTNKRLTEENKRLELEKQEIEKERDNKNQGMIDFCQKDIDNQNKIFELEESLEKLKNRKEREKDDEVKKTNEDNKKLRKKIEDNENYKTKLHERIKTLQDENFKANNGRKMCEQTLQSEVNQRKTVEKKAIQLSEVIDQMKKKSYKDETDHLSQTKALNQTITDLNARIQYIKSEYKKSIAHFEKDIETKRQHILALQSANNALKEEKKALQNDKQDLLLRLSRVAGANLTYDNPNIADLSDEKRPTRLAEEFSELYDNEWTDAFEELQFEMEEEKTDFMLDILKKTSNVCSDLSMGHTKRIKDGFCKLILTDLNIVRHEVPKNSAITEGKKENQVKSENKNNTKDTTTSVTGNEDENVENKNTTNTENTDILGNEMEMDSDGKENVIVTESAEENVTGTHEKDKNIAKGKEIDASTDSKKQGENTANHAGNKASSKSETAEAANRDTTVSEEITGETNDPKSTKVKIVLQTAVAANHDTTVSGEIKEEANGPNTTTVINVEQEGNTVNYRENDASKRSKENFDNTTNDTRIDVVTKSETTEEANHETTVFEEDIEETKDSKCSKVMNMSDKDVLLGEKGTPDGSKEGKQTENTPNSEKTDTNDNKDQAEETENASGTNEIGSSAYEGSKEKTTEEANHKTPVYEENIGETNDSKSSKGMNVSDKDVLFGEKGTSDWSIEGKQTENTTNSEETDTNDNKDQAEETVHRAGTEQKDKKKEDEVGNDSGNGENEATTNSKESKDQTDDTLLQKREKKDDTAVIQTVQKVDNDDIKTDTSPQTKDTDYLQEISIESDFDLLQNEQKKTIMDLKNIFETSLTKEVKETVTDLICKAFKINKEKQGLLVTYITKCVNICWSMCRHNPPVHVEFPEVKEITPFDTNKFKPYTRSGKYIDFIVWPPLFLHEGGPMLSKGVAQGGGNGKQK